MRLLLMGVLLVGLLQGGIQEAFNSNLPMRSFPVLVKGPFGNEKPIVYTYYAPYGLRGANPRGSPIPHKATSDVQPDIYGLEGGYAIDRGHLFPSRDEGPLLLRDSVEKLPIEAQMSILLKSAQSEYDSTPFSRADVEALPSPKITSYASTRDSENLAMLYSSQGYQEYSPLIGYRKDVESPPKSPNINPYVAFYPELDQRFTNLENLWKPQTVFQPRPIEYKSWSRPFNLRSSSEKKVVCYYESWAALRLEPAMFDIEHIDPFACSHLIYSFAGLHNDTYEIASLDPARDVIQGAYKSAVALKLSNPKLKVMIAVGGWAEGGMKYSDMISSQANRDAFVNSVVKFITNYGFDGLDLDWEYPGASDRGGQITDKENLSLLVEQLRAIFQPKGWILSMAIPPAKTRLDEGYDLQRLSKSLDFFNVMVYDLRGPWDGFADHHAPFLPKPTDKYIHKGLNMKDGLQSLVNYGVPKDKIILGLPFYGRSFTLETPGAREKHPKITGTGMGGKYTMEKGYLAYFEICQLQKDGGWFVDVDEAGGPYMIKGNQWIGYDNEASIEAKVNFAKHEDFGGLMLWALDLDDFQGLCGSRWPLMSVIRSVLFSPKTPGYQPMITPSPSGMLIEKPKETESPLPNSEIKDSIEGHGILPISSIGANTSQHEDFVCTNPGYYRPRSSCRVYYVCDEENQVNRFECPQGLAFDIHRRLCRWQSQVLCGEAYSPLTHARQVKCGNNGLYSHPLDCKKYVWCNNREPIVLSCPLDLYFDSRRGMCSAKNEAFCIFGEMTEAPGEERVRQSLRMTKINYRAQTDGPRVLCYFSNWAYYRPTQGQFVPEHIDPKLCTHIVYCFANLDTVELLPRSSDPWIDLDHGFYERIMNLKRQNSDLKILLSLGGWTDSAGNKYSRLVNNPEARGRFVTYTVELLIAYGFDGLELHWEHPVCWQIRCSDGNPMDKQGYAALIKELNYAFKTSVTGFTPLELGVAVSPARAIIQRGYDLRTIHANVDYINLMTYDYHGFWEKRTGHVSPLYYRVGDKHESQNTDFSINFVIQAGVPPSKINLGIPVYSQTFTLFNIGQNTLNSPTSGPGIEGSITLQKGMMSYQETCQQIRLPGWRKAVDNKGATGPYAFNGNQWLSFDDADSVTKKGEYIREMKLGGATVWTIDFDDFPNVCCKEPFPILRSLNRALLRTVPYPLPRPGGQCTKPPMPVTPPPPIATTTYAGGKPKKPSTPYGDLLANTTLKSTAKWQTTWSTYPTTSRPITTTQRVWWSPSTSTKSKISSVWWQPTSATRTTTPSTTRFSISTTTQRIISKPSTFWWQVSKPKKTTSSSIHQTTTPFLSWTTRASTTPRPRPTTKRPTWWRPPPTTRPTRDWTQHTIRTTKKYFETSSIKDFGSGDQGYPGKACTPGEYAPDPVNCMKFFRCVKGELKKATCVPGLHWNNKKKMCDWPHNAQCQLRDAATSTLRPSITDFSPPTRSTMSSTENIFWWTPSTAKRTLPSIPTTPQPPVWTSLKPIITSDSSQGKCRGRETKKSPGKCDEYYECIAGSLHKRKCAPGLHWNDKKGLCDWPAHAECLLTIRKPAVTTPTPVIQVGQLSGPTAGEACSGSKMIGKPGSCSDFLICNQGQWLEKSCAPGLHWNDENKNCDWPEKANCDHSKPPVAVGSYPVEGDWPKPPSTSKPPKPSHTTLELAPTAGPLSGDYMVVCYYTNWARYRPNQGKYVPSNIETSTCTHIVYGFAVLDFNTLLIKPHDSWADIDLKGYQEVTALKSRGMKVTLAIGGWNDSSGDKYNRLFLDPGARRRFVTHVVEFLVKHNFDGLDLDYEYPVCRQTKCSDGDPREKTAFAALCEELSREFKPKNLLLSAAVSPSKKIIDLGYDVVAVNKYLDWIAVMTYDFHGHWDKKTGHVAPMYYHPEDDFDYFNMDFAIRYWIEKGASPKKIVLGMPLYGQSFTLNDPNVHGLNAPANAKGLAGKYTRAAGFLAYYEICKHIQEDGWSVVKDPKGRMGPYAYHGNQWVSFDDVDTIRKKSNYIREMGLGGGMIWALDLDDFNDMCSQGAYPLLKTIQAVLGPAKDSTVPSFIENIKPRPSPDVAPSTPPGDGQGIVKPVGTNEDLKVVCYFTSWASYRPGEGKYTPADIQPELCTHIIYGFVVLDEATLTLKPLDKWLDVDKNYIENIVKLKQQNRNLKVLAALGGWNDSKDSKYSDLVHDPQARKRFNEHAIHFLTHYQLDGLDIDWEYPVCYQADCTKGKTTDKNRFVEWISELSMLFKPRGLLLSAAVASNYKIIAKAYDVSMLSRYLDFINLMTYDYHGQWDKKTGHFSPLYVHPDDDEPKFNADFTVKYWIQNGADPKKLIMGFGMYGQSFTLVTSHLNGLNQPTKDGGDAGPYTKAKGFLAYYEICYFIKRQGWTVVRDPQERMGPYAYKNNQWVGFDDVPMIRKKSEYIRNMGLGGGMIWALDLDDFNNRCSCEKHPLLRTINRVLRPSSYTLADPACPLLGTEKKPVVPSPPHQNQITTTRIVPTPPADSSIGTEGASCNDGEFKRHTDCNKFFECFKGKLRALSCYGPLHWDGRGKCVHPSKAGCTHRVSSLSVFIKEESPEVQTPVIKPRPPPLHDVSSDFGETGQACKAGFKRHPADCNKFFECLHNKLEERTCFPGLQWDGEGRCTWPNQANCVIAQGGGISTVPGQGGQVVPQQTYTTYKPMTTRRTTTTKRPTTRRFTTRGSTTRRPSTRKPPRSSTQWYVPWTPSTASTTPKPTHPPGPLTTDGKMIVCYFTNWAWYRRGDGKYIPEDIDADLCTHILYGFAVLDRNKYIIKAHDSWADYDNKFYERVTGLKAKGKKVILALGGWNDSKGGKYSKLVNSPALRSKFIAHAVEFLEKYNFDGLDLDWEYPKCWQVDCKKGPDSDKDAFSAWMRELSAALKPRNLLLSAAISPSKVVIEQAYHVPDLSRYLDFINVMAYDYHGHWDKQTGHVAPLYHHEESTNEFFNANYTINFLIEKGADKKKLCMGMPMYGQAFTLNDATKPGLNSPARKGAAGKYTRAAGFLAYYEICHKIKNEGYTVIKDSLERIGSYAYKDRQWVGFDDSDMIRKKSQYVMDMGLGGGMIWALDLDDFRNVCNCEAHPLLRTIARVLRGYNKHPEPNPDCSL